ncbi:hypothetical protein TWF103_009497 [Orbilia oligospora]|uniref:Uncharacterized protein n=1 Tax=Orbilia oligospora TaxID=2813651 RepID=A0A7C8JI19_ORBOL|nr:hypothetical protein TWF103_009497 [Orbilia oligospora]KAF3124203.1 hypothetical protein TWF703_000505 [Orbilia oligospora]
MAPYTNLNPISRLILVFRIDSRGPGSIAFQKAVKSLRWSRVLKREQREDVVWTRFVDVGGRRRLIFQSETFAFEDPVLPYWAKQDRTGQDRLTSSSNARNQINLQRKAVRCKVEWKAAIAIS